MKFKVYLTETESISQIIEYIVEAEDRAEAVKMVDSDDLTDENFKSVRIVREEKCNEYDVEEYTDHPDIGFGQCE